MKARFLVGLMVLVMVLTPCGSAMAADPPPDKDSHRAKAVLQNLDTGEKEEVIVTKKETRVLSNGATATTYVVPLSLPGNRLTNDKKDSTLSAEIAVTQYYYDRYIGGTRYVEVEGYEATYTKLDWSVTWDQAKLYAACQTHFDDGSSCIQTQIWTAGSNGVPTSGATYQFVPSWHGRYTQINDVSFQSGKAETWLHRGGSNWYFWVAVCQGGSGIGDC